VIAAMAERGVKNSIMDRLITAVKNFLRKLGVPHLAQTEWDSLSPREHWHTASFAAPFPGDAS